MYDEIKTTIWPNVEFVQGIPLDLEKDSYIDPSVRNMIVLDDLISTAAKDPRITDLFTEGSHHRHLSVVVLNLNLYFSKDPTQRRNCHYLFLINNPVDKQSIMTLAKQMYPWKTQYFLENSHRQLESNNNIIPLTSEKNINDKIINGDHFEEYTPSDQTCQEELARMIYCADCGILFTRFAKTYQNMVSRTKSTKKKTTRSS